MLVTALQQTADVYTMSAGRLGSIAAGAVALAGVVAGAIALRRHSRRAALTALAAGLFAIALGALVATTADGGLGTGNGLGGAFVAIAIGLAATALGALATTRSRRAG